MPPPAPTLGNSAHVRTGSGSSASAATKSRFGFKTTGTIPVKSSGYGRVSVGGSTTSRSRSSSPRPNEADTTNEKQSDKPSASTYADAIRKKRMSTTTGLAACSPMRRKEISTEDSGVQSYKNKNQTGWKTVKQNSQTLLARGTPDEGMKKEPTTPISAMKRGMHKVVDSLKSMSPHHSHAKHNNSSYTPSSKTPSKTPNGGRSSNKGGNNNRRNNNPNLFPSHILHFDPLASEVRNFAQQIYGENSGISDEEIKRLVSARREKGVKSWELKKRVAKADEMVKKLKETLQSYQKGKNRFKALSVEAELAARSNWAKCAERVDQSTKENDKLRLEVKSLSIVAVQSRDKAKDKEREAEVWKEKAMRMESEIKKVKDAIMQAEKAHTEVACALAASEGRCEEATKQAESWRSELAAIEKERKKGLEDGERKIRAEFEGEILKLKEERDEIKEREIEREKELGRLVEGGDVSGVRMELEKLRSRSLAAEKELTEKSQALQTALRDADVLKISADEKEKNFTQLMMSIGEIQRSGQGRESELKEGKKSAEEKLAKAERELVDANHEVDTLRKEKESLADAIEVARGKEKEISEELEDVKKELMDLKGQSGGMESQLKLEKELRARAEEKEKEEKNERIAVSAQMMAMTTEHAAKEQKVREEGERREAEYKERHKEMEGKVQAMEKTADEQGEKIKGLESERDALKDAMKGEEFKHNAASAEEIAALRGEVEVLKEKLANAELRSAAFGEKSAEDVGELERQLTLFKTERRKMFNIIQELRGNVRVFARIRPFLPNDGVDEGAAPAVEQRSEFALKINGREGKEHKFNFDKVFPPSVSQEKVFEEVSEFVQSALDGYNVCLFSYGQTGSGKTHTMQGSGVGQMRGIIPRAIQQVGAYKTSLEKDGWTYKMQVSFLEIYNETIKDLLREGEHGDKPKHEIKVDGSGRRYVTELVMKDMDPNCDEDVEAVMRQAAKHRSVASTDMNAVSSRSHSVFTLHLTASNAKLKQTLRGKLNLVDLAGSERIERSGATGQRAKEAVSINKSLSSLTTVFNAIGNKSSHVPFRDSKLTYLLQPSLSGDGKTLMMVNLSPTEESFGESLCSLRFASAVNKCELGKPKKSIEDDEGEPKAKSNEATTRGRNGSTTGARASSTVRSGGAGRTPSKNGGTRSRSSPSKIRTNLEKKSSRLAGR